MLKPAPVTKFKTLLTKGMSVGKVILSLQFGSIGNPTLMRKSRDERAPTVVSAPDVRSTVTKLNCAKPVIVKDGGDEIPVLESIKPFFSSVVVIVKPVLVFALYGLRKLVT